MPYNPGISYHGDQYISQALGSLGEDAAAVIKDRQDQDKMDAYNGAIVTNALKNGDITLEDYNKYQDMSGKQKTGFAAGLAANVHDKWQKMKDEATINAEKSRTQLLQQQINQTGAYEAPDQGQGERIWDAQGNEIGIYDAQGQPHFYPGGASGGNDVNVLPLKDPASGKTVPNRGIVDKTGQVIDTSTEMPDQVTTDPSGKYYLDNKTKSWKPIPSSTLFAPPNPNVAPQTSTTPPKQLSPQDQQALAWARSNPNDPRAAAILQRLGAQ